MSDINRILALSGLAQNGIKQTDESKSSGDDVAHIESYLDYIDELVMKLDDKKAAYEIQNAADDIRKALDLDPTNIRAKFDESKSQGDAWYAEQRAKEAYEKANPGKSWKDLPYGYKEDWRKKTESVESDEMIEAVGDSAEAFYQLQDEFAGGEADGAHKALIDELIRYLSGDQIADFVADFRRHYDMNDMEENVKEADIELSPGVTIKTDNPDTYKGTKTTTGYVGGQEGEDIHTVNRILDRISAHDPSDESILWYYNNWVSKAKLSDEQAELLKKELIDMGYEEDLFETRILTKEEKQKFRLEEKRLQETFNIRSLKDELIEGMGE